MLGEFVKLFSEGKRSSLTLEVIELDLIIYPSLNFSVTLVDEGFCEAHNMAWVGLDGFKAFVNAMQQCEKTRRGKAELHGISDDELDLVIENSDTLGHFDVKYRMSKFGWERYDRVIVGGFDLDASFLQQMVSDLAYLLTMIKT